MARPRPVFCARGAPPPLRGSAALGSLRSPSLRLTTQGWRRREEGQFTERVLHRPKDGSLSDLDIQPDPKVWSEVCSERGICTPKICEADGQSCFFQQARRLIRTADLLVVNHHLLFTELGIRDEIEDDEEKGETVGVLLPNFDCVILDEAHTMEATAAEHIGIGVSRGGIHWWLHRLWNPKQEKGLLATLRQGHLTPEVTNLLELTDDFFESSEEIAFPVTDGRTVGRAKHSIPSDPPLTSQGPSNVFRIRKPAIVPDIITEPLSQLLAGVAELIKTVELTFPG